MEKGKEKVREAGEAANMGGSSNDGGPSHSQCPENPQPSSIGFEGLPPAIPIQIPSPTSAFRRVQRNSANVLADNTAGSRNDALPNSGADPQSPEYSQPSNIPFEGTPPSISIQIPSPTSAFRRVQQNVLADNTATPNLVVEGPQSPENPQPTHIRFEGTPPSIPIQIPSPTSAFRRVLADDTAVEPTSGPQSPDNPLASSIRFKGLPPSIPVQIPSATSAFRPVEANAAAAAAHGSIFYNPSSAFRRVLRNLPNTRAARVTRGSIFHNPSSAFRRLLRTLSNTTAATVPQGSILPTSSSTNAAVAMVPGLPPGSVYPSHFPVFTSPTGTSSMRRPPPPLPRAPILPLPPRPPAPKSSQKRPLLAPSPSGTPKQSMRNRELHSAPSISISSEGPSSLSTASPDVYRQGIMRNQVQHSRPSHDPYSFSPYSSDVYLQEMLRNRVQQFSRPSHDPYGFSPFRPDVVMGNQDHSGNRPGTDETNDGSGGNGDNVDLNLKL